MDAGLEVNARENGVASEASQDIQTLVKDGKNSTTVLCQRCPSVILKPHIAVHAQKQMSLPSMRLKSEQGSAAAAEGETLQDFWLVDNMFAFENVGFSNTVGTTKYLICADCEIGPIGWHDTNNKTEFFIALDRVRHE